MRASSSLPETCSGDMYRSVPIGDPGSGQSGTGRASSASRPTRIGLRHLRQAEIQNLRVSAFGDEDVCRLNVTMNNALAVCRVQPVGDFDGQIDSSSSVSNGRPAMRCFSVLPSRNSMAMKARPCCLADLINGADVGMVQCRCRLRFALETRQRLRIFGYIVRQKLQGDKAMQLYVFGLVDHAHSAAAQFLDNAVMGDGLADHWRRILGPKTGQVNETRSG